ncbi:SURF1 family protein [Stenotrophomonas sp. SBJS02]|nr:SURF1 family protein [Stenotrophomonas sp. SBJS02]
MRQHTRVIGWLLAVLAMAGFTALGLWQLQRMHAKQAMLDAQGPAVAQALPLSQALAATGALHGVADHGRFLPGVVLLDNQTRHGRAGVKIYRPFRSDEGSVLLVDLGWRALPPDRTLPDVPSPPSPVAVRGLLAPPPSAGLALGRRDKASPGALCSGFDPACPPRAWRRRLACRHCPTACCGWTRHCHSAMSATWTCCRTHCRRSVTWATPCSGSGWP